MEQSSRHKEKDYSEGFDNLLAQLRENYGRVAYSHKTHEKCADIFNLRLKSIKNAQIILSAITTGGLIATLLGTNSTATIIATATSTILLTLTTYIKENDIGELVQKHKQTAGDLWGVREEYLSLIVDITDNPKDIAEIRSKRNELKLELQNIYKSAPRTTNKSYSMAQKALKLNEELTFSDKELDNLLPERFRQKK